MDIETLAVERPEALARIPVDPTVGIDQAKADEIVEAAGFSGDDASEIARVLQLLWQVYACRRTRPWSRSTPLVKTGDGRMIALDGKVSLDANADFRHPEHEALTDKSAEDPLEALPRRRTSTTSSSTGRWDHRQRRRIGDEHLDVVAYAGAEFGLAETGEFPRHRRRGQRGGDGQRAGDHHRRRPGQERLRQRLRRHHRVRRGGERIVQASSCSPAGTSTWTCRWWSGWTATTPSSAGRSSPTPGCRTRAGRHDGRSGPPGCRAGRELRGERGCLCF